MTPVLQFDLPGQRVEPHVFVSHATADKKRFVEPFVRRLQERGIRVWLDQDRIGPGDSMVGRVFAEGIGTADAGIVVLSRESSGSRWMEIELSVLFARKIKEDIKIIVIRLDDVPVPTMFADEYWVHVDAAVDWSAQLNLIVRALGDVGRSGGPRPGAPVSGDGLLRRMLGDPSQWICAYEKVSAETDAVVRRLATGWPPPVGDLPAQVQGLLAWYDDSCAPLTEMLAQCGYVGDPDQPRLWNRPLQRVLRTALPVDARAAGEVWERLALYPALRLSTAIGVAAVAGGREGLLYPMLTQQVPTARELRPVWRVLCPSRVLDPELARRMPGWTGSRQALSTHLRIVLHPALRGILDEDEFAEAFERYEYLRSLLELHLSDGRVTSLGEFAWSVDDRRSLVAERIADEVEALGESWPLLRAGGFDGTVAAVRRAQGQLLDHLQRRFS